MLQKNIISMVSESNNGKGNDDISKKGRQFLSKKLYIANHLNKMNRDRQDLEKNVAVLVEKAKSFKFNSKNVNMDKHISSLSEEFESLDKKRASFDSRLKKFVSILDSQ